MPNPDQRIYLASRSPRRRELLKQIGVSFELLLMREDTRRGADVDETPRPGEMPPDYVMRITRTKAESGWSQCGSARSCWVVRSSSPGRYRAVLWSG